MKYMARQGAHNHLGPVRDRLEDAIDDLARACASGPVGAHVQSAVYASAGPDGPWTRLQIAQRGAED